MFIALSPPDESQKEAQVFLDSYTEQYQSLYYIMAKAEWKSNTKIVEGDSTNAIATRKANEAYAKFTGSRENIDAAQKFLKMKDKLTPIQVKEFERILYLAANNPETVDELVKTNKSRNRTNRKIIRLRFQN